MFEIQASLTNDPHDKEPFHKKQPTAVSSGEIGKPRNSPNHPLFEGSVRLSNLYLELACISPANYGVYVEELKRRRAVLESFPLAMERARENCTVVGTPHKIATYQPADFGKDRKTRSRRLSLPKRLKRIFGARCSE